MWGKALLVLKEWQTLFGSALGPILAFSLSIKYQTWKEYKESIRKTEISITKILHDVYGVEELMSKFLAQLNHIISEIRKIDGNMYVIDKVNFSPLRDIFLDESLMVMKFGSYFLHNKLLWISAGIKNANISVQNLREGLSTVIEDNHEICTKRLMDPARQRQTYASNLENFSSAINEFLLYLKKGVIILVQAKVYNLKMMGKRRLITVWKYEGVSFKYFKNRKEILKYSQNLDALDRIDRLIDKEVKECISEAEARRSQRA